MDTLDVGTLQALLTLKDDFSPALNTAQQNIEQFGAAAISTSDGLSSGLTPAVTDLASQAAKAKVSTAEMAEAYAHVDAIIADALGTQVAAAQASDEMGVALAGAAMKAGLFDREVVNMASNLPGAVLFVENAAVQTGLWSASLGTLRVMLATVAEMGGAFLSTWAPVAGIVAAIAAAAVAAGYAFSGFVDGLTGTEGSLKIIATGAMNLVIAGFTLLGDTLYTAGEAVGLFIRWIFDTVPGLELLATALGFLFGKLEEASKGFDKTSAAAKTTYDTMLDMPGVIDGVTMQSLLMADAANLTYGELMQLPGVIEGVTFASIGLEERQKATAEALKHAAEEAKKWNQTLSEIHNAEQMIFFKDMAMAVTEVEDALRIAGVAAASFTDEALKQTEVEDALRITTVQTAAGSSDMALAFTEVEDAMAIAGVAAAETDEHFRTLGQTTLFVADSVASGFAIMADAIGTGMADTVAQVAAVGADLVAIWTDPNTGYVDKIVNSVLRIGSAVADALHQTAAEDIVERVAYDWGVEITEELAQGISDTADALFGGDRQAAEIFHLADILDSAGGLNDANFDTFIAKFRDVFVMLQTGMFDAAQATQVLDENWQSFVEHGVDALGLLKPELLEIVLLTRQFGVESEEISAFIEEQLWTVIEGLNQRVEVMGEKLREAVETFNAMNQDDRAATSVLEMMGGDLEALQQDFTLLGIYATTTFGALIQEGYSLRDAIDMISDSLDTLVMAQSSLGLEASATLQQLLRFREIVTVNSEVFDAIDGIQQMMVGLANTGYITQEVFSAFGVDIVSQFNKLMDSGVASNDALLLMQPTLQTLWELQHRFGFEVDEGTNHLLAQAEAMGIVGGEFQDVFERIEDILLSIAEALGADLPDYLKTVADASSEAAAQIEGDLTGAWREVEQTVYDVNGEILNGTLQTLEELEGYWSSMGIPLDANGNIDFGRLAGTGSGPALGSTNTLPPGYDYNNPGRVPGMTGGECGCGVTFGPIIVADGTSPSVGKMLLDAIYDEVMRGGSGLDKLRQVLCEARC